MKRILTSKAYALIVCPLIAAAFGVIPIAFSWFTVSVDPTIGLNLSTIVVNRHRQFQPLGATNP